MASGLPPSPARPSGIWLSLGLLNEATLAFGRQDRAEDLWQCVCEQARWLIPSRRMAVIIEDPDGSFRVVRRFARGQLLPDAGGVLEDSADPLAHLLRQSEAGWRSGPWPAAPPDAFRGWIYEGDPPLLLVVPLRYHNTRIGALAFVMGSIAPQEQTALTAIASAYALHASVRYALIRAERLKDDLVSIVSHDFRSPLVLIQGYSELLLSRTQDEDVSRMLASIRMHAQRLASLAADTLAMSRIETGTLPVEPVPLDVVELVRSAVEARADEAGVEITLEAPEGIGLARGDPDRLRQVLENLLSNAVKYSPGVARVRVAVRRAGDGVEVAVADEGLGISSEDVPKLFRKFGRLPSGRELKIPGTGLGLYICRSIIEAHGGRIWAEGEPGKGSIFRLWLPGEAGLKADV